MKDSQTYKSGLHLNHQCPGLWRSTNNRPFLLIISTKFGAY